MKQVAILIDHLGYPLRKKTLEDSGIEVFSSYGANFTVPDEWMPEDFPANWNIEWFKCDAVALAFIQHLNLDADFFWVIEYDTCGSVERWKALFADPISSEYDGLFICPRTRQQTLWNQWWNSRWTTEWCTHTHIMAIYGMSRRAVQWCLEEAPKRRNVYSEMFTASAIVAHGGSVATMNLHTTHCNSQTMKTNPDSVIFNKRLLNHPVKLDSYGVKFP